MAISFRKLAIEATMELADEAKAERGQAIVRFWYIFLVTVYVLLRGAGIGPTDLPADVVRIMPLPSERDPVLLAHANAVLALPVPNQRLQAIARDCCQVVQTLCALNHRQQAVEIPPTCRFQVRNSDSSAIYGLQAIDLRRHIDGGESGIRAIPHLLPTKNLRGFNFLTIR